MLRLGGIRRIASRASPSLWLCRYHHHNFASKGWDCQINPTGYSSGRRLVDRPIPHTHDTRIHGTLAARQHRRQ